MAERPVSFTYDYPMRCPECRDVTTITAQDYHDEINDAHITCAHCGTDVHFGPAVMAIRDPADPALDDNTIPLVAWYHTTTEPEWPQRERPALLLGPHAAYMPPDVIARMLALHADQALHIGTYEAAIESMLRRMRDQDDAISQFFLCRVTLHRMVTVEPGYRGENHQPAARITRTELRQTGSSRRPLPQRARGPRITVPRRAPRSDRQRPDPSHTGGSGRRPGTAIHPRGQDGGLCPPLPQGWRIRGGTQPAGAAHPPSPPVSVYDGAVPRQSRCHGVDCPGAAP